MNSSPIKSMTAFARTQHECEWGNLTWELKSVNHRYLDTQFKLPEKWRFLEITLRDIIRKKLARGKVEVSLNINNNTEQQALNIDHEAVTALLNAANTLTDMHGIKNNFNAREVLSWPGILSAAELDIDEISKQLLSGFDEAIEQLISARSTEGDRLCVMVTDRLDQIDAIVAQIKPRIGQIVADQQARIEEKLAELSIDVDQERLTQEVVMIAQKADVEEELDRLTAHVQEVRDTLKKSEPCGRRLDFLMQELNREANTLGSKSIATDTTQNAVNLKVFIEQMREQIQNIE